MEVVLGLCVGVGLAAACGFRVFVPFLVMGVAQRADALSLASGFEWIGSDAALATFAVATALEVAGYYVPWVDNLLDGIATPAAGVAGTVITASMIGGLDPMLQWSLAIIAGGGAAMTVQTLTVGTRAMSTLTTGGLANPVVSTVEAGASTALAVVAVVVPVLAVLAVLLLVAALARLFRRRQASRLAVARPCGPQPELGV